MFDFAVQIEKAGIALANHHLPHLSTRVSLQCLDTDKNPGADIARARAFHVAAEKRAVFLRTARITTLQAEKIP